MKTMTTKTTITTTMNTEVQIVMSGQFRNFAMFFLIGDLVNWSLTCVTITFDICTKSDPQGHVTFETFHQSTIVGNI